MLGIYLSGYVLTSRNKQDFANFSGNDETRSGAAKFFFGFSTWVSADLTRSLVYIVHKMPSRRLFALASPRELSPVDRDVYLHRSYLLVSRAG
jgi:hypothetical protein